MTSVVSDTYFLSLPNESLLQILRYLNYKDLTSLNEVCQRFRSLTCDDCLWRWQCHYYYLVNSCLEGQSWKETFIRMHKEYGQYISCYRDIRGVWNRLEKFLELHCPSILRSLQDGATEELIEEILDEIDYRYHLPLDLRLSYRLHNGQKEWDTYYPGLIGGAVIQTHARSESLLPFNSQILRIMACNQREWLLLSFCPDQLSGHFINCTRGQPTFGTVYISSRFLPSRRYMQPIECYHAGNSFTEWFSAFVDNLEKNMYYIHQEHIFRFYHEPSCVAETSGITVKPTICFIPELSVKTVHNFFAYRIIMSMDKNAPVDLSCQLMSRHWIITDGNDKVEEVSGPGVVGEYPVMRPGTEFAWVSCCTFKATFGTMRGFFKMRNLQTGAITEVECPCYHMQAPSRKLVSFNMEDLSVESMAEPSSENTDSSDDSSDDDEEES